MKQLENSEKNSKSNKKSIMSVLEHGKLMPQAIAFEEAVLGCIMDDKNALSQVQFLKAEMFYKEIHQKIFKAILSLNEANEPIDILTVTQRLKFFGELQMIGGPYYITQLTTKAPSGTQIQYHARIIYQMYLSREVIRLSTEHLNSAYEDTTDIFDLIKQIDNDFLGIKTYKHESKIKKVKDITTIIHQKINKGNLILKTGWKQFDEKVSLEHNTCILWTGSAKDGKSKIVTQMMKRVLRKYADDIVILWAAFEDKGFGTFCNFASPELMLKPKQIRNNFIAGKEKKYEEIVQEFSGYPISFVEDSVTSKELKDMFTTITNENPTKLPILIVDNILSLGDKEEFRKDPNAMYDYIGDNLRQAKDATNGQVHIIHHYKDSQMDPKRIETGFRPELTDPKGTEVWRRICTALILINNPHLRIELYKQYNGRDKELLNHLLIMDIAANRDDSSDEDTSLIHFLHNLDYSIFEELNEYL